MSGSAQDFAVHPVRDYYYFLLSEGLFWNGGVKGSYGGEFCALVPQRSAFARQSGVTGGPEWSGHGALCLYSGPLVRWCS